MAVAWVSGASSGLGLHTALALVKAGWQVVGGARSFGPQGADATNTPEGFVKLPLDVTRQESVDAFCQAALEHLGSPDALVNAAGITLHGACEEVSLEEMQGLMAVNFFGALRMIKAALPLMREKGGGRIVNFSSVNGLLATPFQGAYAASKHALEGYSEALLMETRAHGVQVMLVEPGDHRGGSQAYRGGSAQRLPTYQGARERAERTIRRDEAGGADPEHLGRKVAQAMSRRRMPARLRVAPVSQHLAVMLHDLLPGGLFARFMSAYYGLKAKGS